MALESAGRRSAVKLVSTLGMLGLGVVVACAVLVGLNIARGNDNTPDTSEVVENAGLSEDLVRPDSTETTTGATSPEATLPDAVDLQSVVDDWASSVGGRKAVVIYDLDRDEVAAEYDADFAMEIASIYKLYVVYEGYSRVSAGEWNMDDRIPSNGRTVGECLDAAIRSSDSVCAEGLWAMIGHDEMPEIIRNDFGIEVGDSILVATPRQILTIMQIFLEHKNIADKYVDGMWDSFLNQPITTANWRRGLPSGFSDEVKVYNKVGWEWYYDDDPNTGYWRIYDDAAIIDVPVVNADGEPSERRFIVVVLTSAVGYRKVAELGEMIEEAIRA